MVEITTGIEQEETEKGHKRLYRIIDFKRNKLEIPAKSCIDWYDPNRTA